MMFPDNNRPGGYRNDRNTANDALSSNTGAGPTTLERSQSQYQRKLARQRQLELMEAAASGTVSAEVTEVAASTTILPAAPTTTTTTPGYDGLRSRETARRFLYDEEDDDDDFYNGVEDAVMLSNRTPVGISTRELLDPTRRRVGNEPNLMDHDAAPYKQSGESSIGRRALALFRRLGSAAGISRGGDGVIMTDEGYLISSTDTHRRPSTKKPTASTPAYKTAALYALLAVALFLVMYFLLAHHGSAQDNSIDSSIGNNTDSTNKANLAPTAATPSSAMSPSSAPEEPRGFVDRVRGWIPGMHTQAEKEAIIHQQKDDRFQAIMKVLLRDKSTPSKDFANVHGPQYMALRWIAFSDPAQLEIPPDEVSQRRLSEDSSVATPTQALVQRYALAVLYYDSYIELERRYGRQAVVHDQIANHTLQSIEVPNPGWKRKDYWMSDKGICMWYGVKCVERIVDQSRRITQYNENGIVVKILLPSNNVHGSLPRELIAFEHLVTLDLSDNNLRGPFPIHMGRMLRLQFLYLEENELTGTIPSDIGYLVSLQELYMANNNFTGPMPISLSRLYHLRILSLEHNELTGNIPDLSEGCKVLTNMWLDHNKFKGFLPFELALLTTLFQLHLNDNQFSGTIPPEIANSVHMLSLRMENNNLTGTIPSLLFQLMSNLQEIHLDNNHFTGSIPSRLQHLTSLHTLSLHHNSLSHTIPSDLAYLQSLTKLHLYNNQLTGSIPPDIASGGLAKSVQEVWLNDNSLSGPIPSTLGRFRQTTTLYLEHNRLSGTIPHELDGMISLQTLRIFDNPNITGTMPDSVCAVRNNKMTALKYIAADCRPSTSSFHCDCCDKCY